MIASALKKPIYLLPLPPNFLKTLCKIVGKEKEADRLTGSLCVDISKIRSVLGWKPPFTMQEGIIAAVGGSDACL